MRFRRARRACQGFDASERIDDVVERAVERPERRRAEAATLQDRTTARVVRIAPEIARASRELALSLATIEAGC
jgi:hypothetical protein